MTVQNQFVLSDYSAKVPLLGQWRGASMSHRGWHVTFVG